MEVTSFYIRLPDRANAQSQTSVRNKKVKSQVF